MNLEVKMLPGGIKCDSREKFKKGYPDSVTIHWIGPYPHHTPEIVWNWWKTGGLDGSAHLIIKDGRCVQCWPFDKVAWHAGNSRGNRSSIGIEVVPMNIEGEFSEASIATLREALDSLFPGMPIKRHHDWSGKDCPRFYCDNERWASLKKLLGRG